MDGCGCSLEALQRWQHLSPWSPEQLSLMVSEQQRCYSRWLPTLSTYYVPGTARGFPHSALPTAPRGSYDRCSQFTCGSESLSDWPKFTLPQCE